CVLVGSSELGNEYEPNVSVPPSTGSPESAAPAPTNPASTRPPAPASDPPPPPDAHPATSRTAAPAAASAVRARSLVFFTSNPHPPPHRPGPSRCRIAQRVSTHERNRDDGLIRRYLYRRPWGG